MTEVVQLPRRDRRITRAEEALAIRDHSLLLLRANGAFERVGDMRLCRWQTGSTTLMLRTPFSGAFPAASPYSAALQRQQGTGNLAYGLDIWCGSKVFFAEWDGIQPDRIDIVSFRRGAWENELLALAGTPV